VARTIAHYLGIDEQRASTLRVTVPNDSAPAPFQIPGCRTLFPPSRSTVLSRVRQLDKALVVSVACWRCTGSRPCTRRSDDVPTFVATIWKRQLIWLGLGFAVAVLTFRTSPRMLEWATPFVYAIAVFLLVLTLFIAPAPGPPPAVNRGWRSAAPLRAARRAGETGGDPDAGALARHAARAARNAAGLIVPGLIAGLPCVLVLKQPDLGSAIIFIAILFVMLFWAGTKPSLLLLAASPSSDSCSLSRPWRGAYGSLCSRASCCGGGRTCGKASPS